MRIKVMPSPVFARSNLGRLAGALGASFVINNAGIAVGKTNADLGEFKGLQRAANQWAKASGSLVLTPVDGQVGNLTFQIVRDGIILARSLGNAISQQEPVDVTDLATYAREYAITLASLAGVNIDTDPSCRSTDYRGDLPKCATVTDPAPGSIFTGTPPKDDDAELPVVNTNTSSKVKQSGFPWWILLVAGGGVVVYSIAKKKPKKSRIPNSRVMGLRGRR